MNIKNRLTKSILHLILLQTSIFSLIAGAEAYAALDYRPIEEAYRPWLPPGLWGETSNTAEQAAGEGCASWTSWRAALNQVVEPECNPAALEPHPTKPDHQNLPYSYTWQSQNYDVTFEVEKLLQCTEAPYLIKADIDRDGTDDSCIPPPQCESSRNLEGNPVNCSSGEKIQTLSIYSGSGHDPLSYSISYSSPVYDIDLDQKIPFETHLGKQRNDNHYKKLDTLLTAGEGRIVKYRYGSSSRIYASVVSTAKLTGAGNSKDEREKNGYLLINSDTSYTYKTKLGGTNEFDTSGNIISTVSANGLSRTYSYSDSGKLESVTNHYGKSLLFYYNSTDLVERMVDPAGEEYLFEYDGERNLVKIIYPDNTPATSADNPAVEFLFEDPRFPNSLTGKINEKGIRFASWTYDSAGRAISSEHSEGAERIEIDYSIEGQSRVTTYVTDQLANEKIYHYAYDDDGRKKVMKLEQLLCSGCTVGDTDFEYDENGNLSKFTSPNGNINTYTYNNKGLETKRVIGSGSMEERTETSAWYSNLPLPYYQIVGDLKTQQAFTNTERRYTTLTEVSSGETRTTNYSYFTNGKLYKITGPRDDVTAETLHGYDADGNLISITNALNHVTTFSDYDSNGRVGTLTDANGIVSSMTYTPRGWVESSTFNGALTQYEYYPTGSVKRITTPSGHSLNYEYDDGERLVAIVDSLGNRIDYTRDLMGNITSTEIKDSAGALKKNQTAVFNALGQLNKSLGSNGQSLTLSYDADGNPINEENAKANANTSSFDALNRLNQVIDADNGATGYTYDNQDRLTEVTDPEGETTSYEYNAFGEMTKLTSPDTGVTTYTYDAAGNMLTKTDARGITVTYTYDALNRPLTQSYADASENIVYSYDDTTNGNNGIGRLTSVTDKSGTTDIVYNAFGLVTEETLTINGQSYQTLYQYDANGQLTGMTYPSGRTLTYYYDTIGRINEVTTTYEGVTESLASAIDYLPFGPMNTVTYGNGNLMTRSFDLDYRLVDKTDSALEQSSYFYDLTNNVIDINYSQEPADDQSFSYDSLSRLLTGTGNYGAVDFSYDKIGNRLDKTFNSAVDSYVYASSSHQLDSVSGTNAITNTFDASGNTITRNDTTFTYNERGRMSGASRVGLNAEYEYNFKGQRVFKQVDGLATHYIFDLQGRLIAEADSNGLITSEYVFLNGELLSKVEYTSGVASAVQEASIDNNWTAISFDNVGSTPVVIAGPATNHDSDPGTIQMRNVADGSVEVRFAEWDYLDDVHASENVSIMALPQGRHTMADGSVWEVGTVDVTKDRVLFTKNFDQAFAGTPTLILTAQTANDGTAYSVRAKSVTASSFAVRMNEEEITKNTAHVTETVGYVAIYSPAASGMAEFNGVGFDYVLSSGSLKHQWKTLDGYSLKVEEEKSKDTEINHTTESVDLLLIDGLLFAQDVLTKGGDSSTLRRNTESPEAGGAEVSVSNIYYYHNSHLATPETMTDENQAVVWEASYTPFGKATITTNTIENNVRFPGQYFDSESGLHYNYFRDYDPEIGRYIQSDPIGLAAGQMSTYAYVDSNPVNATDRFGLWSTAAHNHLLKLLGKRLCWSESQIRAAQGGSKFADNFLRGCYLLFYHHTFCRIIHHRMC